MTKEEELVHLDVRLNQITKRHAHSCIKHVRMFDILYNKK